MKKEVFKDYSYQRKSIFISEKITRKNQGEDNLTNILIDFGFIFYRDFIPKDV